MAQSIRVVVYGALAAIGTILLAAGSADRHIGFTSAAAAADAPASGSVSGNGITLDSVSVDFPDSDRAFPGGTAADIVNANCLACHSAGMVLNQPALTQAQWLAEAKKMRNDFKAPIDEKDVPAIVAYLTQFNGPK
jgi:mono/diheme cytochrome c family protein